jgi:hypothetical protein
MVEQSSSSITDPPWINPSRIAGVNRGSCLVTNEEKTSLKAACLQAATTLIAARDSVKGVVDVDECLRLAAELYCRLTTMKWEHETTAYEAVHAHRHPVRPFASAK